MNLKLRSHENLFARNLLLIYEMCFKIAQSMAVSLACSVQNFNECEIF